MERNYATIDVRDHRTIGLVTNGALDLSAAGNGRVTMRPPANSGVWYYEKDGVAVLFDTGVSGEFDPLLIGAGGGSSFNFGQLPFVDVGPMGGEGSGMRFALRAGCPARFGARLPQSRRTRFGRRDRRARKPTGHHPQTR